MSTPKDAPLGDFQDSYSCAKVVRKLVIYPSRMGILVFSFLDKAKALTDFIYVMGIYFLQALKIANNFSRDKAYGFGRFLKKYSYTNQGFSSPIGIFRWKTAI